MHRPVHRSTVGAALVLLLTLVHPVHVSFATSPSARIASLTRAAADPGLADWQRAFYRERLEALLAGGGPALTDTAPPPNPTSPSPVWSVIADTPRRQGHTLVYDGATGRVIAFGGRNGALLSNAVFVSEPDGVREWHTLLVGGTPPPARMAHVAVLDAANRRMLVYGGTDIDGSYLADLWALNLDGPPEWAELSPAGDAPSARANHFASVDPATGRLLVFGGTNGGFNPLLDLWALSLDADPAWSPIVPGGPFPAGLAPMGMVLDEGRRKLIVVGPQTVNYSTNWTLARLSLDVGSPTWTTTVTGYNNSPSAYSPLSISIDPIGDRLVCVSADYNLYEYALPLNGGTAWSVFSGTGHTPPARYGRAWAVDVAGRRLFAAGGGPGSGSSGRAMCDLWSLDLIGLTAWSAITGEPAARYEHSMAFDPARGTVHLFGGQVDSLGSGYTSGPSNDLWALSSTSGSPAWSPEVATGGPLVPRSGASLIVDPVRDRLVLFGGTNGNVATNEVWQRPLSGGTAWTPVAIGGTLPHQRYDHAAVYDPVGDRMLVFGGYDYNAALPYLGDLWALSLGGTPHWTKLLPDGTPPSARSNSRLDFDPSHGCAYLVGGAAGYSYGSNSREGEVWQLTLTPSPRWDWVTHGVPDVYDPYSESTCAAWYDVALGSLMRVAYDNNYYGNPNPPAVWMLTPPDTSWTVLTPSGTMPQANSTGRGVFDPQTRRLIWYGGVGSGLEGTYVLSFGSPPLAVPPPGAQAPRALRVSPNPARGECRVSFTLAREGMVRLELLDLGGRRVRGPVGSHLPAGPAELRLGDLSTLPAGVYFARLSGAIERNARVAIVH